MEKWDIPLNLGVTAYQKNPCCGGNNTGASHPKEVSLSLHKLFSFSEQEAALHLQPSEEYAPLNDHHPPSTPK
jgi:hypothetical protein